MSSSEPALDVARVGVGWGGRPVLREVAFRVETGELAVLLGPNGSGKTTLLRTIAGLERPAAGRIRLFGRDVTDVPPHRRGVPLMFQEAALFPHRTAYENIAYAPLLQRRPRAEVEEVVGALIPLLGLAGLEERTPDALSGGERQKVALARTLAARPRLVLLDEPFASIDPEAKAELRAEFRRALRATGTTALHVTHDREEGFFLGDHVGLLVDGRIERWGAPEDVYRAPGSPRAARFLGYNLLPGGGGTVAVLPEEVEPDPTPGAPARWRVVAAGTVGREGLVILEGEAGERIEWRPPATTARPPPGHRLAVRWPTGRRVDAALAPTTAKWSPDLAGP